MSNPHPVNQFKPGNKANPNGRPKKGESLTELMREYLDEIPEGEKKTNRRLFIEKTAELARKGDPTAQKLLWNYQEGMPKQTIDTNINLSEQLKDIAKKYYEP